MNVRVLGCYGAQLPGLNPASFLLNRTILVDAGTLTSKLTLSEQLDIDYILLTHAHLDHVRDIVLLADNIKFKKDRPVTVIGCYDTIDALRRHLFNNVMWPDFTVIPTADNPVIRFRIIEPGREYDLQGMTITAIPVNHVVETFAYIIQYQDASVIFVGDTGPTELIWKKAGELDNLRAVFIETSFPNNCEDIARTTGHLTPFLASVEISKLPIVPAAVYLYHMKPEYLETIIQEVALIEGLNFRIVEEDENIRIGCV